MPSLRGAGGGLSLGRALGASDDVAGECRSETGAGVELAGTARQYGLNWKSVATIVQRAVQYGLKNRARPAVHVIGMDEVSRRKGQVYLTVVYDLARRVLLWVGEDRTEEAVKKFFTEEMGRRRCQTLRVVCMDMWAPYAKLVREHAVNAQILFDRFHIVKHLNEAVEEVRRSEMRRLSLKERV